jgi:steroid 5-alpha reductase family enzyme
VTLDATLMQAAALGLAASLALALAAWAASVPARDVSIVDSAWAFLVWLPAAVMAVALPEPGPRATAMLALAAAWALRLSGYIAWRHRGQPEDHRYQAIRRRNEPHFAWKSLVLVFGLQAVLGWIVAAPLMAAVASPRAWSALDGLGIALFTFGLLFEAVADAQLARFKADPSRRGQVLATGLWRYTRHPNYFGECCLWWGAWLVATAAGAWWTVFSPLLMTILLLKVSGVALLEKDIGERRPAYADYVRRTNAFVPGRPRA